jgi:hypothetical protein
VTTDEPPRGNQPLPAGELRPDDRGHDEIREAFQEGLSLGEPRPLTREERGAAGDKGISACLCAGVRACTKGAGSR